MKIICHRGYWKESSEKNSDTALRRGFSLGLGTETDIRDLNGEIVISHDPAKTGVLTFADLLSITPPNALLALNVKSDGLAKLAVEQLHAANHHSYVFFDMSVPDMLAYMRIGAPVAARLSEYEPWVEAIMNKVNYIWLDAFEGNWYDLDYLRKLIDSEKKIMVVSSELHGRIGENLEEQWGMLDALIKDANSDSIILCTDYPELAMARFK
jgi:hypothetical protein